MERDLVYDVGMHNGADTAHYLEEGFRVVAVEADPELFKQANKRFSNEIKAGKLTILELAIGPEEGTHPFWISSNPEYNSFSREHASKWGETAQEIEVQTKPFTDILAEFGVPYYLKIDIEGADHFCLEALSPADLPAYLSFEKGQISDLITARNLGYSRFKLISQENFRQLNFTPDNYGRSPGVNKLIYKNLKKLAKRLNKSKYAGRFLKKGNNSEMKTNRRKYAYGSSGPFAEKTDGPWRSFEEVAFTWLAFDLGFTHHKDPKWEDWFDVHCAL